MDELLARERAAHEYVSSLQVNQDVPFKDTLAAFEQYRHIVQEVVFTKFSDAEKLESRLWRQHTEMRKLLSRTLKDLRKQPEKAVEIRVATEMYLRFVRHGVRFYRNYIAALAAHFGGIPQLEVVAHKLKKSDDNTTTSQTLEDGLHNQVLSSCYRNLVYLGDLCRYRASDCLDNKQDFGPAIGYYHLACTIKPDAGWGFHQQAIVALEQKDYLKGIYFLYRAFLVDGPIAAARSNLDLQYEKANAAWEKGELIPKGSPVDLLSSEKTLIGWFVRLHSMCVKGQKFRGYDEILQELITRLQSELRMRAFDSKLQRMTIVNIAAQQNAVDAYRSEQDIKSEQAFYFALHVNILFFTTLLDSFYHELAAVARLPSVVDVELSDKLTPIMTRVLPALRLYSNWLVLNNHLLLGLASSDFLSSPIAIFWRTYAQVLDAVSAVFPIFDLEDCEPITYLLEEDAEVLGFKPLIDTIENGPVFRTSHNGNDLKPRFSDAGITRFSSTDEMLGRVLGFLDTGSHIAINIEETPIFIRGTRFSLSKDAETFELPRPPTPVQPKPVEPQKPLSYAAAAAKAQAEARKLAKMQAEARKLVQAKPISTASNATVQAPTLDQGSGPEHMSEGYAEDNDTDHPVTPPSTILVPDTVIEESVIQQLGITGFPGYPKASLAMTIDAPETIVPATSTAAPKRARRREDLSEFSPRPKVQGNTSLWTPSAAFSQPHSRLNSPSFKPRVHERVNSTNSIRSATSPRLVDSWSSIESAPKEKRAGKTSFSKGIAASGALQQSLVVGNGTERLVTSPKQPQKSTSPLLFGGSSIWTPGKGNTG